MNSFSATVCTQFNATDCAKILKKSWPIKECTDLKIFYFFDD